MSDFRTALKPFGDLLLAVALTLLALFTPFLLGRVLSDDPPPGAHLLVSTDGTAQLTEVHAELKLGHADEVPLTVNLTAACTPGQPTAVSVYTGTGSDVLHSEECPRRGQVVVETHLTLPSETVKSTIAPGLTAYDVAIQSNEDQTVSISGETRLSFEAYPEQIYGGGTAIDRSTIVWESEETLHMSGSSRHYRLTDTFIRVEEVTLLLIGGALGIITPRAYRSAKAAINTDANTPTT